MKICDQLHANTHSGTVICTDATDVGNWTANISVCSNEDMPNDHHQRDPRKRK